MIFFLPKTDISNFVKGAKQYIFVSLPTHFVLSSTYAFAGKFWNAFLACSVIGEITFTCHEDIFPEIEVACEDNYRPWERIHGTCDKLDEET